MNLQQNHAEIAWSNWTQQFKKSSRLEALVKSLYRPIEDIQETLRQLHKERGLDTAKGAQLDGIGVILDQTREVYFVVENGYFGFVRQRGKSFGGASLRENTDRIYTKVHHLNDKTYRQLLYCQSFLLKGGATGENIHLALSRILDIKEIRIKDLGNATFLIHLSVPSNTNRAILGDLKEWMSKAAGISCQIHECTNENSFGFKAQGLSSFSDGSLSYQLKEHS